jgi:anti-sigma factor RsiW
MSVDEAMLMAYVDGTLTARERQEVERQIAASADVVARVARLEKSRLPYREAFASQKLPPVPESLARRIGEMTQMHAATTRAGTARQPRRYPASANDNDTAPMSGAPEPRATIRSRLRVAPGWLAVAFVAGAFCLGAVLRLSPTEGMPGAGGTSASPWIQVAAGYQQLYSRATVSDVQPDPGVIEQRVDAIRREDRLPLRVPDLRDAGLTFRDVQRLRFHGRPLIQLVYLPDKGEPVALCIIHQPGPDQAIARQTVNGMNVVTWRQGELGYALIGASDDVDLAALGRRIADRSVDQLFGEIALPTPGQRAASSTLNPVATG